MSDPIEPDPTRPDPTRPDTTEPDTTEPDTTEPDPVQIARIPSRPFPPATLTHIPIAEIDADALARDRTRHDEPALIELRALHRQVRPAHADRGLRPRRRPTRPSPHGLISGFRRLAAFRGLYEFDRPGKIRHHPRLPPHPADLAQAMTAMVEENAIRVEISPWEQAMIAVKAARSEAYPGIDAAIAAFYGNLNRLKRTRIRAVAQVADELDGWLTAPETLSLRQLLRLAPLIARGYGDLLRATLADTRNDPDAEWRALLPILARSRAPRARGGRRPPRPPAPHPRPPLPRPLHPPRAHPHRLVPSSSAAATPPATCSTASSTRSSACSARPSPATSPSTSPRPTAADATPGAGHRRPACRQCARSGRSLPRASPARAQNRPTCRRYRGLYEPRARRALASCPRGHGELPAQALPRSAGFLADGRPASAITRQRSAESRKWKPPRTQARRPCRYTSARSTARASRRLRNHLSIFRLPERRVRVVELTTNGGRRTAGVNRSFSDRQRDATATPAALSPRRSRCAEHCTPLSPRRPPTIRTAADQEPDRAPTTAPTTAISHVTCRQAKAPTISNLQICCWRPAAVNERCATGCREILNIIFGLSKSTSSHCHRDIFRIRLIGKTMPLP